MRDPKSITIRPTRTLEGNDGELGNRLSAALMRAPVQVC